MFSWYVQRLDQVRPDRLSRVSFQYNSRSPSTRRSSRSQKCRSKALRHERIAVPCRVFSDICRPSDSGYWMSAALLAGASCSAIRSSDRAALCAHSLRAGSVEQRRPTDLSGRRNARTCDNRRSLGGCGRLGSERDRGSGSKSVVSRLSESCYPDPPAIYRAESLPITGASHRRVSAVSRQGVRSLVRELPLPTEFGAWREDLTILRR